MDLMAQHEVLASWLTQYGSFALFALLALGIFALPIPDESLMVLSGVLMYKGTLGIAATVAATYLGSMTGITLSYILGKTLGQYALHRFGSYIGMGEDRVHSVHEWFHSYGGWALFFGYFIPGIRHLTGIFAGSIGLTYDYFALFAYTGAILWASTFLAIGYFFGSYWVQVFEWAEIYVDEIVIAAVGIVFVYLFLRYYKK